MVPVPDYTAVPYKMPAIVSKLYMQNFPCTLGPLLSNNYTICLNYLKDTKISTDRSDPRRDPLWTPYGPPMDLWTMDPPPYGSFWFAPVVAVLVSLIGLIALVCRVCCCKCKSPCGPYVSVGLVVIALLVMVACSSYSYNGITFLKYTYCPYSTPIVPYCTYCPLGQPWAT